MATNLPPNFAQEVVASKLNIPTGFAFLPDGRILITEKAGVVRVYKRGTVLPAPLVDLRSRVNSFGDRGLMAIAVDPRFSENGFIYLYYAHEHGGDPSNPKTARLTRLRVEGDRASPQTEVVLVGTATGGSCNDLPAGSDCIPNDANHMGGSIRFGKNGTILLSTGDGGTSRTVNDNALRAQDLDSLAGKLLRVTPSGQGLASNPFWNGRAGANRSKVWAYGLRNPFRFTLRPGSGMPYVADVGWHDFEEISATRPGSNLGWPCYEAESRTAYEGKEICRDLYERGPGAVRFPLHAYSHSVGRSITGGVFYTANAFPPPYRGAYFFGDYVGEWIRVLRVDADDRLVAGSVETFATDTNGPVAIELGPDGSLYYLAVNSGELRRIVYTLNAPPSVSVAARPRQGRSPLTVRFSSAGTRDADGDALRFRWNFGDGTAASSVPNPRHTYKADGLYEARLRVTDARGAEATATLAIRVGRAPNVSIVAPASTFRYRIGQRVALAGKAVDPDDGELSGSRLSWRVIIRHCPGGVCHTHPLITATGAKASFVVPDHEEESFLRIFLTAVDRDGLSRTRSVEIRPAIVGTADGERLVGTELRDVFYASGGDDRIVGLGGDDDAFGGPGADVLVGGRGGDRLVGGPGRDVLRGGRDSDRILAGDGRRDLVDCGAGADRVVADARDRVSHTCESVKRV